MKRLWCWEGLGAGGEGDNRGWDGWMASPTRWMWIWVNSGSWWWTGRPGVLQFMGLQRVWHDWATELNWAELMKDLYLLTLLHTSLKFWLRRECWALFIHSFIIEHLPCIRCSLVCRGKVMSKANKFLASLISFSPEKECKLEFVYILIAFDYKSKILIIKNLQSK